ncbi:MAG: ABC transporter permease [Sedimentibacter saalensis]|jgi:peptide/nickel transport system permease protein|uniref:Peptide/nickel transport system permease protein n=1 Tax=Sedimentibacter saalensis TaxID=130788 RepID=A0A562JK58_9FIRM|nr:ABC transporter permease [Sedimentibacter saalensis]MEA5094024.1 ABC transporter permease [Sedimentibacter saalensis]TWH83478.1 peptide/nickel transport system permease protein [Sedimentibacter saalensis]
MLRYVLDRVKSSVVVLLVVSIITFAVLMIIPGDPAQLILGTEATPEMVQELHAAMGLDRPLYQQYLGWLNDLLHLDMGTSYVYGESVKSLITGSLPVTLSISVFAMIIAVFLAFLFGMLSAIKKNSIIDYFSRSIMQLGTAIPSFWIGMVFIVYFGLKLKLFPVSGFVPLSDNFAGFIKSITLPSVVLAIGETGTLLRIVRSSMLDSLNQDYMDMAKVKGLGARKVYVKYALRGALVAPLTIIGMQFAKLAGGTVVVETIFSLPGLGRLVLSAVEHRDIVLLQGLVMFITAMVIFITLAVDVLIMFINPRIKSFQRGE